MQQLFLNQTYQQENTGYLLYYVVRKANFVIYSVIARPSNISVKQI